jgi:hypothetical protein
MDETVSVSGVQSLAYLIYNHRGAVGLETPLLGKQPAQVGPVHKPHRDVQHAAGLPHRVDRNHVRVLNLSRDRRLPLEPSAELGVIGQPCRDHLERDDALWPRLTRSVDHPHAAPPRDPFDHEAIEVRAWSNGRYVRDFGYPR